MYEIVSAEGLRSKTITNQNLLTFISAKKDIQRGISPSYCVVADMLFREKGDGRASGQASRNDGIIPTSNVF